MLSKRNNTPCSFNTPVVGIHAFVKHLPANKFNVSNWAKEFGKDREFVEQMVKEHGLQNYFKAGPEDSIVHMCTAAVHKIMDRKEISPKEIDLVIYFHTVQTSIPLPPKSITTTIINTFRMVNAVGFSLAQLNCVSFIATLQTVKHIMTCRSNINNVLVIGADRAPSEQDRNIDGYQMESDAAIAAMVRRDCKRHRILSTGIAVDGEHYKGYQIRETQSEADTSLRMAYLTLYKLVRKTIEGHVELNRIEKILPHNVNPSGLRQIERCLRISDGKMFMDNISDKGHMYGCDGIVNLIDCEGKYIHSDDYYLIISIGYGRTYGCALLQA